jgi:hypothetical protein
MMTRVFLAAGVAALAIAAPAAAGPHGGGGNQHAQRGGGGGGQRGQMLAPGGGGGGGHAMRAQGFAMPRAQHAQGFAMQRPQSPQRAQRSERVQMRAERQRPARAERMQSRVAQRQQVHANQANHAQAQQRMAARQQIRANHAQANNRMAARQQLRANRAQAQNDQQQLRADRMQQAQNRLVERQQMRANRIAQVQNGIRGNGGIGGQNAKGFGVGGCPPGLVSKGCMPPGLAAKGFGQIPVQDRVATLRSLGDRRFAPVDFTRREIFAPTAAAALLGMPISTASAFGTFSPLPQDLGYLYPATPNYYYQYGNGYLYQVDRGSSLIDALIPLLAGGFLPGSYLPQAYMSSYVPSYYGLNSFYPANYGYGGYGAGYGYDNLCNRYANGVVYQVDCVTGMVENVVPLYAGGYGVGQMLPSAYNYYNVPLQYRSMYYPTADYSYWYAPGAIYQYDQRSSLITSVAALMSPGFSIGQPLPAGYGMYNVPLAYRATYYDTPDAWYRYNNGYIYQVNPTTQLVTAIVASLLT